MTGYGICRAHPLDQEPSKIYVTPIQSVPEEHRGDEARNGDIAVLGDVVIGERYDDTFGPNEAFIITT